MLFPREDRIDGVSAHPAGVGALSAVEPSLMVLRNRHWLKHCTIREHEERRLLSVHEFSDHEPRARVSDRATFHEVVDCRARLFGSLCDNHALTCCETVGFDHDWQALS